jgi:hypothetical protein
MALVYWFSDGAGVDMDKGGPDNQTPIPTMIVRWIRANTPSLIVYGGDVYKRGTTTEFAEFFNQMDSDVGLMCEAAGNHDWEDAGNVPGKGRIPRGYEAFWSSHPESKQPVASAKQSAARYDHFMDVAGWRLIFVDTGDYKTNPWPGGDESRRTWLTNDALKPGRSNILLGHHSRVSCGHHGDNAQLDGLWNALFDASGPRVAFTIAGHDHNVNVYGPRSKNDPEGDSVPFAQGIHVFTNGAGGDGHYGTGFFARGDKGDIFSDDDNYCVTRINLIDERSADVDVLSFGKKAQAPPVAIPQSLVKVRL